MISENRPQPPPFISPVKKRRALGRWWKGLTGKGKLVIAAIVCIIVAALTLTIVSLNTGTGVTDEEAKKKVEKVVPAEITIKQLGDCLCALRISGLIFSLDEIAARASSVTYTLEKEVSELSSELDKDALFALNEEIAMGMGGEVIKDQREETSQSANRIADTYIPQYQQFFRGVVAIQQEAAKMRPPPALQASLNLLLRACDRLSVSMMEIETGLYLLEDADPKDITRATGIIQGATPLVNEGSDFLNQAKKALQVKD